MAQSDLDAVYIASPNGLHFEYCKLFLENGIHVLCEKPLVPTVAELNELYKIATKNSVVLVEAIKIMHDPHLKDVRNEVIKIGNITQAHLTFCRLSSRYNELESENIPNIFNPNLFGGSLMDIGVYPIYLSIALFGKPNSVSSTSHLI